MNMRPSVVSCRLRAIAAASALLFAAGILASPLRAADATWSATPANVNWNDPANWDVLPAAGDLLFFGVSSMTALNNNFGALTQFNGLTFNSGASAFTLGGSAVTLGTSLTGVPSSGNITNDSLVTQTINLGITLGGGNHTIAGGVGGLALNPSGGLLRNPGGVVNFSGTVSSSTITNGSAGIIGGWATFGGTDWATVDGGGNIVAYSGYTDVAGGGTISSNPAGNVRIDTAGAEVTMAAGGTTDINSILYSVDGVAQTVTIGTDEVLRLGAQGGIFRTGTSGTQNAFVITGGTLTAGGADDAAGEIVINAGESTGASSATNPAVRIGSTITDNGAGVVSLTKTGRGYAAISGVGNSYTGGTFINEGRLQGGAAGAYGTGPVTVQSGGQAFFGGGTWTNDFFIAGTGPQNEAGTGAIRGGGELSGTITLLGDARISGTPTITGQITDGTGSFDMTFGSTGNVGGAGTNLTISNPTNDWDGDTILVGRTGPVGNTVLNLGADEVIPNGTGKGNVIINENSGTTASAVTLNLNGFNETINGLASGAGNPANTFVTNNSAGAIPSVLTLGDNNASATFGGTIQDGFGTVAITKIGAGTQTLSGASHFYSGPTNVEGGTLVVLGELALSAVNVSSGATLAGTGAFGTVTMAASSTLDPGVNTTPGTMTMASITFNGGDVSFGLVNPGSSDAIVVDGSVAFAGATTLSVSGGSAGTYALVTAGSPIDYSGGVPTVSPVVNPRVRAAAYTADTTTNPSEIQLIVTGGSKALTWTGAASGVWDWNSAQNWVDEAMAPEVFFDNDTVTFGNTAGERNITVVGDLAPGSVQINNDAANGYSFSGSGSIVGATGITKDGVGVFTLATNNTYTGETVINAGTLQVGNGGVAGTLGTGAVSVGDNGMLVFNRSDSVAVDNTISGTGAVQFIGTGTATIGGANTYEGPTTIQNGRVIATSNASLGGAFGAPVTISSGGTLDISGNTTVNNADFGFKQFQIEGTGVGGFGVLVNGTPGSPGVAQQNAFEDILLTGDATIGAYGRFDVRGGAASLDLAGHTLTKLGAAHFGVVSGTITDGNIIVNEGNFALEGSTNLQDFGTGTTVTFNNGTRLQFFNTSGGQIDRQMVFNGEVDVFNNTGSESTFGSAITLNGNVTFGSSSANSITTYGGAITETGGARTLTKADTGTLQFNGTSNHSGATTVSAGTLVLGAGAAMTQTSGTTVAGDATLINNGTLAGNVTLSGGLGGSGGTIAGNVTADPNARFVFELSTTQAALAIGGTFTETLDGGVYVVSFTDLGAVVDQTYTLLTFTSTNFNVADFVVGEGLIEGDFTLTGTTLEFTVTAIVPEPGTWALFALGGAIVAFVRLRRCRV
jgi:autotransporter-associated beta strand protein